MNKIRWSTLILLSAAACGGQASNVAGSSGDDGANTGAGSGDMGPAIIGTSGSTTATSGDTTATTGDTTATSGGGSTAGTPRGGMPADDAGPAHTLPLITATACGTATCTTTQQCCVSLAAGRTGATVACADACTGASIAATCSSAASCTGGQVCCATLGAGGRNTSAASTSCEDSCAPPDGGRAAISIQVCSTDAECPQGDTCRADVLGLDTCVPAPVVRDAGVREPFDAGIILRIPDGGFEFDAGVRRMRDAAARD
jgi:hypothetical protein